MRAPEAEDLQLGGGLHSQLWAQGATQQQVLEWVTAVFPGALERAEQAVLASPEPKWHRVGYSLETGPRGAVLRTREADHGFLHQVAARAECPCLVIDEESFALETGFAVFSEYRGGVVQREWFDPLRGMVGDEGRMAEWLRHYCGAEGELRAFLLREGGVDLKDYRRVQVMKESGRLLSGPRLEDANSRVVGPSSPVVVVLTWLLFGSWPLWLPWRLWSAFDGDAVAALVITWSLCGWWGVFDFELLGGKVVPRWLRWLWFVVTPPVVVGLREWGLR